MKPFVSITELLIGLITIVLLTISLIIWKYTYWSRKKVPHLPPRSFSGILGHLDNPLRILESPGVQFAKIYREMKRNNLNFGGFYAFLSPIFLAGDSDLIKHILTKDFMHFEDRGAYHIKTQAISNHLITTDTADWRNTRPKMSPAFSSGKLKQMFNILVENSVHLVDAVSKALEQSSTIQIKELSSCFTIDVIGSCGFGLECKSFETIGTSDFKKFGVEAVQPSKKQSLIDLFCFLFQNLSRMLDLKPFSAEVSHFFTSVVEETVLYREKNAIRRNDFLQQLIDLKNEKDPKRGITMDSVVAQSFLFFIASYDTSSTTITFALLELSNCLEAQEKARKEVEQVIEKYGDITYEALADLKYVGQIIDETLRMHPPAPMLTRRCTKAYKIPNTDITIPKNTSIVIPILGIQNDPENFPNPEIFDPSRFSEDKKKFIDSATYLPFGDGPRICLGLRFALMQTKLGLATLLRNFQFNVHPSTTLPVKLKSGFLMNIDGDVNLTVEKI